jgi:hypothetical protein
MVIEIGYGNEPGRTKSFADETSDAVGVDGEVVVGVGDGDGDAPSIKTLPDFCGWVQICTRNRVWAQVHLTRAADLPDPPSKSSGTISSSSSGDVPLIGSVDFRKIALSK